MRTYHIAHGTLLNALWWPKWEGNPKRGDVCIRMADSLCCTAENTTTLQSNYTPNKGFKKASFLQSYLNAYITKKKNGHQH